MFIKYNSVLRGIKSEEDSRPNINFMKLSVLDRPFIIFIFYINRNFRNIF